MSSMKRDPIYTVTVQGTDFLLTKSQIEFDAPNYFTACFLGDFEESKTHHLKMSRDPDLFRIISDYLCGYQVLPLADRVMPTRISPELVLPNLKADAEFYQLDGLVQECEKLMAQKKGADGSTKRYLLLGCEYEHLAETDLEYHIDTAVKPGSHHWRTIITEERLRQRQFSEMDYPEYLSEFEGYRKIAAVERFAKEMGFPDYPLVGWHHTPGESCGRSPNAHYQLLVVLAM
ncbi:unnamed protein product [Rhizoctonia solani]|uniref:BTB domain-containing protein n=1 Tax=Rhizoctonia solani TaxID=456999 RepID=A0A8H2WH21_9AGAM|nr:unnamed protein product [Rhizoctonia solani]